MGPGLPAFPSALGASIDGDGTSWSYSTPPVGVGGLLAQQGHGLSDSHNKYVRPDHSLIPSTL
jgi:hypothetical protein